MGTESVIKPVATAETSLMEQKTAVQQKVNSAKYAANGIILQKYAAQSKAKECTL